MLKDLIDQKLKDLLPPQEHVLHEMATYSLEKGKRLRPLLTLTITEALGHPIEDALQPACAIEMIHTYSLIHDDLPAMDDDDYRRGKPTLHQTYPESHAILTGDFLLTYAFEILSNAPNLSHPQKNQMISTLAMRGGKTGLCGGQILDLDWGEKDEASLFTMHLQKTGALITAALEIGAIICNCEVFPFQALGEKLGLAYQLADDLLDQDGSVALLGEARAKEELDICYDEVLRMIHSLPLQTLNLEIIAREMIFRTV